MILEVFIFIICKNDPLTEEDESEISIGNPQELAGCKNNESAWRNFCKIVFKIFDDSLIFSYSLAKYLDCSIDKPIGSELGSAKISKACSADKVVYLS